MLKDYLTQNSWRFNQKPRHLTPLFKPRKLNTLSLGKVYKLPFRKTNMSFVAVIVKLMPESPETDLAPIKQQTEEKLKEFGATNFSFEEKPIAFGLVAVMAKFAWLEAKDTSLLEEALASIPHVASVQIVDYRRAFG